MDQFCLLYMKLLNVHDKPEIPSSHHWLRSLYVYCKGEGDLQWFHISARVILEPRPPLHFLHKTFPGNIDKISHCAKFHCSSCFVSWDSTICLAKTGLFHHCWASPDAVGQILSKTILIYPPQAFYIRRGPPFLTRYKFKFFKATFLWYCKFFVWRAIRTVVENSTWRGTSF